MKTWTRVCIHTYTVMDQEGQSFTVERGKIYRTSAVYDDQTVTVFSSFWVRIPAWVFAGEEPA